MRVLFVRGRLVRGRLTSIADRHVVHDRTRPVYKHPPVRRPNLVCLLFDAIEGWGANRFLSATFRHLIIDRTQRLRSNDALKRCRMRLQNTLISLLQALLRNRGCCLDPMRTDRGSKAMSGEGDTGEGIHRCTRSSTVQYSPAFAGYGYLERAISNADSGRGRWEGR
jgi:hypothetical protein